MMKADLSKLYNIKGSTGNSVINVGGRLADIRHYIGKRPPVIITDTEIYNIYRDDLPFKKVIVIGLGEKIKTLQTISEIYSQLISFEADRNTFICGIGGGMVCDIAGFTAGTYMRGVDFGFVATSLLAQVDASVGGKNGVNFAGYKNMIGLFRQPEFVICDLDMLCTLSEKEVKCGFSEIIKHALIADKGLLKFVESNCGNMKKLKRDVIFKLVNDSVRIKSSIVGKDETEKGQRAVLNFGHTIGHALQKVKGLDHGEAVSIGMVYEAALSVKCGTLLPEEYQRMVCVLENLEMPLNIDFDVKEICAAMKKDKKRNRSSIKFVLLDGIGRTVFKDKSIDELESMVNDLCEFTRQ